MRNCSKNENNKKTTGRKHKQASKIKKKGNRGIAKIDELYRGERQNCDG